MAPVTALRPIHCPPHAPRPCPPPRAASPQHRRTSPALCFVEVGSATWPHGRGLPVPGHRECLRNLFSGPGAFSLCEPVGIGPFYCCWHVGRFLVGGIYHSTAINMLFLLFLFKRLNIRRPSGPFCRAGFCLNEVTRRGRIPAVALVREGGRVLLH